LSTSSWLYGVKNENHKKAMKAACNELKGLSAIYLCNVPGLVYLLMTLIHYRGYCLLAVGLLPLKELQYGSNDGGKTVHSEPKVREMMLKVGKILNLEEHFVANGKPIIGPGDIEVHLGNDDRYYILDFGRLFPPEAPLFKGINDDHSINWIGNSVFYNLLRGTFVQNYRSVGPLCSAAAKTIPFEKNYYSSKTKDHLPKFFNGSK